MIQTEVALMYVLHYIQVPCCYKSAPQRLLTFAQLDLFAKRIMTGPLPANKCRTCLSRAISTTRAVNLQISSRTSSDRKRRCRHLFLLSKQRDTRGYWNTSGDDLAGWSAVDEIYLDICMSLFAHRCLPPPGFPYLLLFWACRFNLKQRF